MGRLLSGRVGVTSYSGLSTERQQTNGFPSFLSLEEAEPNLGLPADNDFVLHGDVNGRRFWAASSGGGGGGGTGSGAITVQDQGVTASGFGGSITTLNFQGNGVSVIEAKTNTGVGGTIEVGISTVLINASTLNIQDNNGFVRPIGVTTIRVGTGLSFVELPTNDFTSGIVSFFSNADANIDFQDDRGNTSLEDVRIIRVGAGLTVSLASAGIASIAPTGKLEYLNVTGIASSPIFDGNLQGNVTGNVAGNITGDVTGNVNGTLTGDFNSTGVSTATQLQATINSGLSTITQLQASTINASGIITSTAGISAGGSGFTGSLNSTGISTVSNLFGTHVNISGIATSPTFDGDLSGNVTGNITGNINSAAGVNTITTLTGTTATYTSFVGSLTGSSSLVDIAAETEDSTCSIMFATNPTGSQAVKSSTQLTFDAAAGIVTATAFAGDGSRLTNLDASKLTGTLSNLDGSALTNIVSSSVDVTATNTTNADHFILFSEATTGVEELRSDQDFKYNPSTNTITAGAFNGPSTGLINDPSITVSDLTVKGSILPDVSAVRDIGSPTARFANMYTSDMHFCNQGGKNDVDGTWGHWTMQEGESDMFLLNQRTGKKYKINLTEV